MEYITVCQFTVEKSCSILALCTKLFYPKHCCCKTRKRAISNLSRFLLELFSLNCMMFEYTSSKFRYNSRTYVINHVEKRYLNICTLSDLSSFVSWCFALDIGALYFFLIWQVILFLCCITRTFIKLKVTSDCSIAIFNSQPIADSKTVTWLRITRIILNVNTPPLHPTTLLILVFVCRMEKSGFYSCTPAFPLSLSLSPSRRPTLLNTKILNDNNGVKIFCS